MAEAKARKTTARHCKICLTRFLTLRSGRARSGATSVIPPLPSRNPQHDTELSIERFFNKLKSFSRIATLARPCAGGRISLAGDGLTELPGQIEITFAYTTASILKAKGMRQLPAQATEGRRRDCRIPGCAESSMKVLIRKSSELEGRANRPRYSDCMWLEIDAVNSELHGTAPGRQCVIGRGFCYWQFVQSSDVGAENLLEDTIVEYRVQTPRAPRR